MMDLMSLALPFDLGSLLENINRNFTLFIVFPSLLLLGLFFSINLKFVQLSKLKMSFRAIFQSGGKGEGNISHYQAVASVLASNFGTGNISGMAVALVTGGPGALVWMWVMTFLSTTVQYANCLLGIKYRRKNEVGEYVGGPMYYLSHGLGYKKLAHIFSLCVIFAAFGVGGFVQINSIALPLKEFGIAPWITGVVIAFFVGIVILGGSRRVALVSSAVVPFMAILYLGASLFILYSYRENLLPALQLMFQSAFSPVTMIGGALGFTLLKSLTTGFDRAIFATDAGTGIVPMLQSGAKTKDPVISGVVSLLPPFLVMIVCTATGLVLIVTGAFQVTTLQSTNMVTHAFREGIGNWGIYIVLFSLLLFGYTTTIAWASCLEKAVDFLFGRRFIKAFLLSYIVLVPLGALLKVGVVWLIADIALSSMLLFNMIGVAGLSKEVIRDTRAFFFPKIPASVE